MSFNPDPTKQAQEVIFSHKIQKTYFNNKLVKQVPSQKHLGLVLDNKLNFQEILKLIKLLDYYVNCKTFCHVSHY